ncbi:MAG: phage tail tape measure protein, partial [Anaerolinea sp.]|nr:phage tail tape measure protein [Anaerolinea sp.]
GASGEALASMEAGVVSLAGSTQGLGHDVSAIGGTMAELNTRLGLTGDELTTTTGQFLDFTRLVGGDGVRNVQLVTRVMGDWGIENEGTGATLDMLFGAGQAFGIGVDNLAAKVVQFGAPLRQMGFTLEESVALFGKWEKEGVNAELAIGSLRIAAGQFARDNIPLRDGLNQTMEAIIGATDESEALAIAMDVFGARAGPDMAAAIREGRFELDSAIEALRATEGGLADAAERTIDFRDKFPLLLRQVQLSLLPMGDMLAGLAERALPAVQMAVEMALPIIGDILNSYVLPALETGADFIEGFFVELGRGEDVLGAIVEALLNWVGVGDGVAAFVIDLEQQIRALWEIVQPGIQFIVDLVTQFVGWQDILMALGAVVASIVIPIIISLLTTILPIIAVGALLIASIALVRNAWESNWGGIQQKTQAVIGFVQNLITTVMTAIKTFWSNNGDAILSKAAEVWAAIQAAIQTAITIVQNVVTSIVTAVKTFWEQNNDGIKTKAETTWATIQTFITTAITTIQTVITTIATAIQTFWESHGATILEAAQNYWTLVTTFISDAFTLLTSVWGLFRAAFEGDWEAFGATLVELWENAWSLVINFLTGLWNLVSPLLQGFWTSIQGWFTSIDWGSLGQNIIDGIVNGIVNAGAAILDALMGIIQGAIAQILLNLGISSPSRVMANVVGKPMAEGVLVGWEETLGRQDMTMAVNQLFVPQLMASAATAGGGLPAPSQQSTLVFDFRGAIISSENELQRMIDSALARAGVRADVIRRTR